MRFRIMLYQVIGGHRCVADLQDARTLEKAKEIGRFHCLTATDPEAEISDTQTGQRWKVDAAGNVEEVGAGDLQGALGLFA